jgi:hypothetical protein
MQDFDNAPVMTRELLQTAMQRENDRINSERIKQEEFYSLRWVRTTVYAAVIQASTKGLTEQVIKVPKEFTQTSYDYAIKKINEWFPDCDKTIPEFNALADSVSRSIRISWS